MESFLFGFCLIAVVWLIIWTERDTTRPSKHWWPFDMRGFVAKALPEPTNSWRGRANPRNRA